jgi:hypothetical protein
MSIIIRDGISTASKAKYNFKNNLFRQGSSITGIAICNLDGKYLRGGSYVGGTTLYNFDGKYFREGISSQAIYFTIGMVSISVKDHLQKGLSILI